MILSRTYMVLSRVALLIALIVGISAIVYAFMGQWSNAGQSVYSAVVILVIAIIAADYNSYLVRRARR